MALADEEYRVIYGGKELHNGRESYLLLIEPGNGLSLHLLIDAKSYLIEKVSAKFATGMMGGSELSTEYGDFRAEAGVLFPYRLTNFQGI